MHTIDGFLNSIHISNNKPHRPLLLLALAKTILEDKLESGRIIPTDETLISNYDLFWKTSNNTGQSNIHYPFFALGKTSFWKLVTNPGMEDQLSKDSFRSFRELSEVIAYAEIDPILRKILLDPLENRNFQNAISLRFLNNNLPNEKGIQDYELMRKKESYALLLKEPEEFIKHIRISALGSSEVFVRNADFKKIIPEIYDHKCAFTGRRIRYGLKTLVEACHIEPFAQRQLCTLYNGISLSPDIHKLFDAHYITIDEDYKVVVSKSIEDNSGSFSISTLHGKQLFLPAKKELWPRQNLLNRHREFFRD